MAHIGQHKFLSVFLVIALLMSIIPAWPTVSFAAPVVTAEVIGEKDVLIGRDNQPAGEIKLTEPDTATVAVDSTITVELLTNGVTFADAPVIETSTAGFDVESAEATLTSGNTMASWTVSDTSTAGDTTLTITGVVLDLDGTVDVGNINALIKIRDVTVEEETVTVARAFEPGTSSEALAVPKLLTNKNNQPAGDIHITEDLPGVLLSDPDKNLVKLEILTEGVAFSEATPTASTTGNLSLEDTVTVTSNRKSVTFYVAESTTETSGTIEVSGIHYDVADTTETTVSVEISDGGSGSGVTKETVVNATLAAPAVTAEVIGKKDVLIGRDNQPAGEIKLTEPETATIEAGKEISITIDKPGVSFAKSPTIETSTAGLDVESAEATLTSGNTTASWVVSEASTETGTSLTIKDIALNLASTATAGDIDVEIVIDSVAVEPDTVTIARAVFPGVSSGPPVVVAPGIITLPFPDVPASHFAFEAISHLKDKNIVNGYPNGLFRPGNNVTRAEFTKMVVLAKGLTLVDTPTASFSDVSPGHWAFRYIATAEAAGIVKGYPEGDFRPAARVSRAEIAAMVTRAAGFATDTTGTTFPDVSAGHWAFNEIMTARSNNIVQGFPDGMFRPNNPATRAEAAVMIFNWIK